MDDCNHDCFWCQGGGAYLSTGTATNFSNCSIAGNQADDKGGGIYAEQGARVQLDDRSAVQSNKPDGCYRLVVAGVQQAVKPPGPKRRKGCFALREQR
jgi:predicted outer membrane repeat protein